MMSMSCFVRMVWVVALVAGCAVALPLRAADDAADGLAALVELLSSSDDAQFQYDVLKGLSDGLKGRREVKMPTGWEPVAAKLAKSFDARVRDLSQSLSVTFGSASALANLREVLLNKDARLSTRSNALVALLSAKDPKLPPALQSLLGDTALRGAALRGLAAYDDAKTPAAILAAYPSLNPLEKKDALNTLVSRAAYAKPLLAAVGEKKISSKDLSADLVRLLRNLKDPQLNEQVAQTWGVARESQADKLADMARYKKLIADKGYGSASRGRALFSKVCQQCHTLFGEGGKIAPDITGSNRGDLDYILHNAVDPNAEIPNDYRTSNIEMKDDRAITGIVTKQDDNALTVMTANETLVLPRNEVKSLAQTELSMMPEGLLQALSDDEVRDLLAYLRSPAQVAMPVEPK
jgi:putative heme-binding domain-containing protein